jgi:hypothetical protein
MPHSRPPAKRHHASATAALAGDPLPHGAVATELLSLSHSCLTQAFPGVARLSDCPRSTSVRHRQSRRTCAHIERRTNAWASRSDRFSRSPFFLKAMVTARTSHSFKTLAQIPSGSGWSDGRHSPSGLACRSHAFYDAVRSRLWRLLEGETGNLRCADDREAKS